MSISQLGRDHPARVSSIISGERVPDGDRHHKLVDSPLPKAILDKFESMSNCGGSQFRRLLGAPTDSSISPDTIRLSFIHEVAEGRSVLELFDIIPMNICGLRLRASIATQVVVFTLLDEA